MNQAGRFELDSGVRIRDGGRLLVGGTPPRLLRLTDAGASGLRRILDGATLDRAGAALAAHLDQHGLLHPLPGEGADDPAVTTIVPVLDGGDQLATLVAASATEGPTIVVDDGSTDGTAERAERAGARVIRHDSPRGPAAARNAGLAAAETEIVAFLDADCEVTPGWRRGLAALLVSDGGLAVVAPRVRSVPGDSTLARYEELASPLDLGPHASLVGPARRVSYLPAAAMVARRDAVRNLGGFDESMRFGEDVDLVWRLLDDGARVRYLPSREVRHRPRRELVEFARQRAGYGSSAAELVRRHGAAAAPLHASRSSSLVWGAALLRPRALPWALAASTAIVARRGVDRRSRAALAELAVEGQFRAGVHLSRALSREWLPLAACLAPFSRRARAGLLLACLADSLPLWTHAGNPIELLTGIGLHALDNSAYAAGMWREMMTRPDFRALMPGSPPSSQASGRS